MTAVSDSVLQKLAISPDQLNSMFTALPIGGWRGEDVAESIRSAFNLDPWEPLGEALFAAGVLTEEEGRWLDDLD